MRQITREDILPMDTYARERDQRRRQMVEIRRNRRLAVGPDITVYFESFATMLHQIHEMLHIERGGEAQIEDELRAYNPLIPDGRSLSATLMIEIDDPIRRARQLRELAGIENTISLRFDDSTIAAEADTDAERTTADGKTSAVHFLKFRFSPDQIGRFRAAKARVLLAIEHPRYDHMAALPDEVRTTLAEDFD
jgi:hypothetical protein